MKRVTLFLSLLTVLLVQTVSQAALSAVVQDPFGSQKEIPVVRLDGKDYVPLYALAGAGKFLYDFDRITRKAVLQNDEKLIQIMPDNNSFSCNSELAYSTEKPLMHKGGVYFPVSSIPVLMEKIGLDKYTLIFKELQEYEPALALDKKEVILHTEKKVEKNEDSSQDLVEKAQKDKVDKLPRVLIQQDTKVEEVYKSIDHMLKYIVLDPGHGGQDPGGVGVTGLREKMVVMKVSDMVRQVLAQKLPDVEVITTRVANNQYVSLADRTKMANDLVKKSKHGVFISIHANISRDGKASGYETYFLSSNPSDDSARAVSALENGYFAVEKKDLSIVSKVLSGMLDAELIRQSQMLAESVTAGYQKNLPSGTLNRGVKSARFYVLEGVMVPSILTEIGFLSNPREEKLMKDDAYLRVVANAIAEGIINFVLNYNKYKGFS